MKESSRFEGQFGVGCICDLKGDFLLDLGLCCLVNHIIKNELLIQAARQQVRAPQTP
jgi:hypothetical protein